MNNPGKMATLSKQDEEKQNTNTRQYVLDTNIRKKPTNKVNKTWDLVQTTGGKDKLNIVFNFVPTYVY